MLYSVTACAGERETAGPSWMGSTDNGGQAGARVLALPARGPGAGVHTQVSTGQGTHHPIELCLLGDFRLLVGGELVRLSLTGQRLLALLACRGRLAARSQVAQALWPDVTSARANANLRTALYRLARACPVVVHATATHLQLAVGVQIDLEQTTRLANRVLAVRVPDGQLAGGSGLLVEALRVDLYGDLLPGWDDEWLTDHQYRYRQLRLTVLEVLSRQLADAGHHGAAVQTALAAVQTDALRDSAHQTLIRAWLAQGNRHEAMRHYATYRRILRDELGLDPPAEVSRLLYSA